MLAHSSLAKKQKITLLEWIIFMNKNTSQFGTHKLIPIKTRWQGKVQCPECGQDTHELYHARFTKYGEEVLMCDACYEIEPKD